MPKPLLDPSCLDRLRVALSDFTVDGIHEFLGRDGQLALARGDLAGVTRQTRLRAVDDERLATLIRLFLLGEVVPVSRAAAALHPLAVSDAAGVVEIAGDTVRARVDLRPYAEREGETGGGAPWWVVSDFGSDVRDGPLATDHVLGIGSASLTLAQATPRLAVGRALDLGTGCGLQALHLTTHAGQVIATDVSTRALRMAATTAALSGCRFELRHGSLLDPVADERFELIVANPPFVISPGTDGYTYRDYTYRDAGLAGDEICATLLRQLPGALAPGGCAQLLANWIIPTGTETWSERLAGWLTGRGCDAWVWQREVADPAEYVSLWLADAGERPGTGRWQERYDAWLDWFAATGVAAIGLGVVTLWQTDDSPQLMFEDVPQQLEQPAGAHLPGWLARRRWLARTSDAQLLATRLSAAPGLVRARDDTLGPTGWATATSVLRQRGGMCWEVPVDDAVATFVAGCDETAPAATVAGLLAAAIGVPAAAVADALVPVLRELIGRGILQPVVSTR